MVGLDLDGAVLAAFGDDGGSDLEDAAVAALGGGPAGGVARRPRAPRPDEPRGNNGIFIHKARVAKGMKELKKVRAIAPLSSRVNKEGSMSDEKAMDWIKCAFGSGGVSLSATARVAAKCLTSRHSTTRATTMLADFPVTGQNRKVERDSASPPPPRTTFCIWNRQKLRDVFSG